MLSGIFSFCRRARGLSYLTLGVVVNPFSLLGNSLDLGVSRAAMSLDHSPLATSCGVSMCRWTVCYSGDKSCDSGMVIS